MTRRFEEWWMDNEFNPMIYGAMEAAYNAGKEATRAHLAKPRGEPVAEVCDTEYSLDDDGNKVLHALVYEFGRLTIGDKLFTHPAHTEAEAIELDRLAAFIHTASCLEEVAMAMAEHGEAVRRILKVSKP